MAVDPQQELISLRRAAERHRDAAREFGLAGYVTMVEQHKAKLRDLHQRIRALCAEHGLDLPPDVPRR